MVSLKVALQYLITIIIWCIIIKSLFSWFPGAQDSKIYSLLDDFTEPIEAPIRKLFSIYVNGPIDFTPMMAIFVLYIIGRLIDVFL